MKALPSGSLKAPLFYPIYVLSVWISSVSSLRAPRPTSSYIRQSLIAALAASRLLVVLNPDNSSNQRRTASAARHMDQHEKHF
jgi:hypothetical protein